MNLNTIIYLTFILCCGFALKLEKVLILSRHHIRQPLTDSLQSFTPHAWPVPNDKIGHLTPKGAILESYMGEYISNWLKKEDILPDECPSEKNVFIYANSKQRTRESAKAFVKGAFNDCNTSVYCFKNDVDEMDPIFNPILRNTSSGIKEVIIKEMEDKINSLSIIDAYKELDNILNVNESNVCEYEQFCSFAKTTSEVVYNIGKEPDVTGPLKHGNAIVDTFMMLYFTGVPMESIAWGKIKTLDQLHLLGKIMGTNQKVRFGSPNLDRDVAKQLLNYIYETLTNDVKFILLMGHDSNLESVMGALEFKDYVLPGQIQSTPIGGKLIFQKWNDNSNTSYIRINYVYQTIEQMRNSARLSDENPPQWILMEIKSCPIDERGLCSWDNFLKILNDVKQ